MVVLFHFDRCVCEFSSMCEKGRYLFTLDDPYRLESLTIENKLEKGFIISCLNVYILIY